ncbi:pyrimidine reductase family protein [Labedella populi]|uniref:Pyrimidine reductase family protein n=1 Tax=Labedella populi TaxID=2498850 RepID=A0A3S3ZWN9_9MICO|nr:pyrimidine reductase family protein [Labedella populi]RWZ64506.1 pyrimidine reductase family protein [Labedella populi]
MSEAALDRVWSPGGSIGRDTGDHDVLGWYEERVPTDGAPWLRVNFVSSVDGAVTVDGLSGGLGSAADRRVFDLLRVACDVVVVAAGTVRAEGYGPLVVDDHHSRLRTSLGFAAQPRFGIVSNSLDLDPDDRIFRDAPVRPLVLTSRAADRGKAIALERVADVIECGDENVDGAELRRALWARDLRRIHSEGGPALFGELIRSDAVDEVCLTVTPLLAGGDAGRIASGAVPDVPRALRLAHVVEADGALLLRYVRSGS